MGVVCLLPGQREVRPPWAVEAVYFHLCVSVAAGVKLSLFLSEVMKGSKLSEISYLAVVLVQALVRACLYLDCVLCAMDFDLCEMDSGE